MKFIYFTGMVSLLLFSCKKEEVSTVSFSEARYTIIVTGKWSSPDFSIPAGAHFTTFVGMVHNSNAWLWKEGDKASAGTELLAEIGNGTTMLVEIDSMVRARNTSSLVLFTGPVSITGSVMSSVYCNTNYSRLSFASMLGPTPDWFVGVSGIELYNGNKWVADTTIDLYPYDAGTEEGDRFDYNNPATIPQQNIHLLQPSQATILANGNARLAAIATARFVQQ
ncbi:MAG: spondin domain-containing protein [Bacteroidota bacterium]